jgi:hypothetical protein
MTPDVPSVLAELAGLLVRNADPATPPAERVSALGLSSALLMVAAEVWDGAAARLVEENRALAALLPDTASEADLRLSALRAENARLRALLIAAHIAAEQTGDAERETAIWAELLASTERRKLSISLV